MQWCERRCAKSPTSFRAVQLRLHPAAPAAAHVRQVTRRHRLKRKCEAHRMKHLKAEFVSAKCYHVSARLGPSAAICRQKSASSAGRISPTSMSALIGCVHGMEAAKCCTASTKASRGSLHRFTIRPCRLLRLQITAHRSCISLAPCTLVIVARCHSLD